MKNPFELRYELLALAHDHLESQYYENVKFAEKMIQQAVEQGQLLIDATTKFMPKFPTIEEVLKEAKKFYYFVDTAK